MQQALLIRLRPRGPWRIGPSTGGEDSVDTLFRSDRVFSAVTIAMRSLGFLDEWLEATARAANPSVVFSSLFPFQNETLFAIPPKTLWPPPSSLVGAPSPVFLSKIRWKAAQFVPIAVIDSLLTGKSILADQWLPDPESGCLLRRDRPSSGPFRSVVRSSAAVDRLGSGSERAHSLACVEFEPGAGLWAVARFSDEAAESQWSERIQGAFRLLADTGFGGRRTSGWGQSQAPEFQHGKWPHVLLPETARLRRNGNGASASNGDTRLFWLLSVYSPGNGDGIDWRSGDYDLTTRTGSVESGSATRVTKQAAQLACEGSVLSAAREPIGRAVDVAPAGFAHPVYRSGFAVAVQLPVLESLAEEGPVEAPSTEEAVEERPCEQAGPAVLPEERSEPQPEPQPEPKAPPPEEPSITPQLPTEPTIDEVPERSGERVDGPRKSMPTERGSESEVPQSGPETELPLEPRGEEPDDEF